jgi:hypothetical protein
MLRDTLHTQEFTIILAEKSEGLVMLRAELVVLSHLLLLAGQLQGDVILGQLVGLHLLVMLESASWALQVLLLLVHALQALLAYRVTAAQVPRHPILRIEQLITHWAFHLTYILYTLSKYTRIHYEPPLPHHPTHQLPTNRIC